MDITKLDGDLEILIDYRDKPTVTLRGEVDFRNRDRLREVISSLAERGNAVDVDLRELIFMDSTGVSALVDAAKALQPFGGRLNLVAPSAHLVRMLKESGFSGVFGCDATVLRPTAALPGSVAGAADRLHLELPNRAEMISHIRVRVAEFAQTMPFTAEQVEDIKLAVGEASANAMRHGVSADCCVVEVRAERLAGGIEIRIRDRGCGFDPDAVCPAKRGDLVEGGRGIMFMRALMDDVRFHFHAPGTEVEMVKWCNGSKPS